MWFIIENKTTNKNISLKIGKLCCQECKKDKIWNSMERGGEIRREING